MDISGESSNAALECQSSYGTHLLDHLAANGASLTGGQVTVVTVGQVDAHFLGSLHLETVHSLTGLGDVDLIIIGIAHVSTLLCFLRNQTLSEESVFCSVGVFLPAKKTIPLFLKEKKRRFWKHFKKSLKKRSILERGSV